MREMDTGIWELKVDRDRGERKRKKSERCKESAMDGRKDRQ